MSAPGDCAGDAVAKRLRAASEAVDVLRKKIVATKEGGMITGEERLRENLTDLYSNLVFYDGGPTQTQSERADALARSSGCAAGLRRLGDARVAGINAALRSKEARTDCGVEPAAVGGGGPVAGPAHEAQGAKNSPIVGAVAAAPGNNVIPSASSVSRSVLWC